MPSCNIGAEGAIVTNADQGTANGSAQILGYSSNGPIEYSLDTVTWQLSDTFTGLFPNISYTVFLRDQGNISCATQVTFTVGIIYSVEVDTTPSRDWLPVGQPIMYGFSASNPTTAPALVIELMVSPDGDIFNDEYLAAVIKLEADTTGNYSVNVAPYLQSTFNNVPPSFGVDIDMWRFYRLKVYTLEGYTPDGEYLLLTDPQRALNGVVLVTLSGDPADTISYMPDDSGLQAIVTTIDQSASTISNTNIDQSSDVCRKYPIILYWLNRSGGWETYTFDGRHEYSDDIGDSVRYRDSLGNDHVASIPNVVQKVAVKSGLIPKTVYDLVTGIRYASQVWMYSSAGWQEGYIESGTFLTKREGDRLRECNFTFVFSNTLAVQTS